MLPDKDEKGNYPSHTGPGGYPLVYISQNRKDICAVCASKKRDERDEIVGVVLYWEGMAILCDECGEINLESAYGEIDEENQ